MPGNRALFDRAMEQSREAARQKNWDVALKEAIRALQEFPQDLDARSSAAVALFNTGKHQQALQVFEELHKADPNNPFALEYLARIHEQLGRADAAFDAYVRLADLQAGRRLGMRAVEALREAIRLRPDANDQRLRLARLLEEVGGTAEASGEYLELARRYQANPQTAIDYAETALRLDPANNAAKTLIASLSERLADLVQSGSGAAPAPLPGKPGMPASGFGLTGALRGSQIAADRMVIQAQEQQERGDLDAAIQSYERAVELGTERSDVFYSLGLLYQERGDHARAIALLPRAAADEEYALSAHYMLGTSYQALGRLQQAAEEFEQTIRLLPLETIGKSESEDMIQMYESAAQIYIEMNDMARAASLYSTLANFLASKRWGRDRAEDFRQKAKELTDRNMFAKLRSLGTGALVTPDTAPSSPLSPEPDAAIPETWGKIRPITDFLRADRVPQSGPAADIFNSPPAAAAPSADPLAELEALVTTPPVTFAPLTKLETQGLDDMAERYVMASERYVDQGLTLAAIDACMEVIRIDADYLPIHLRMGEIYEREGRREEALAKYQLLIETYTARNEQQRSIDVYLRLIELSPDATSARARLADLLRTAGRIQEAADQVAQVAASYFRLGQTNKALEEYRRGLQWAPNNAQLRALYGQALLKLERYEAALTEFRRALEADPKNPVNIARINMTLALMNEQPAAIWQSLASLLELLKEHPQQNDAVQAEYRTALLVVDSPVLHYILGVIQQQVGQHQSALLEFEQAESLLQEEPDRLVPIMLVYQVAAESHIALGQASEARSRLEQSLRSPKPPANPETARYPFANPLSQGDVVRRMAEAYAATGDLQGAEQALQEAKQHLPYDRAIYTKLADIYFQQGRLSEALAQLEELATYYENRQDPDRAIESLEMAVRLAPNNINVGMRLGRLYIRRGYLDKGVDGLVRVAEQQRKAGQLKDAVNNLQQVAEVYSTLGKQDEAMKIYDKIVQIMPNDVEIRQWLAIMHTLAFRPKAAIAEKKQLVRIYLQQRDLAGATEELFTIIALDQNDVDAHFQLADVLFRREEYEQALRIYTRLLKMPDVETERVEALQAAAKRMYEQQQGQRKGS
jgi:tetratricopeptide (TPR) repeat protein